MDSKKKLKMFPWMGQISSLVYKSCFSENSSMHEEVFVNLYHQVSLEISNILQEENFRRAEKLWEILSAYIFSFHMSNITYNKDPAIPKKSFLKLISCLVDLGIFLCREDPLSSYLENCIRNMFLLTGSHLYSLWDIVLQCELLNRRYSVLLLPIISRIMQQLPQSIHDPVDYMKMILLMRRWRKFCNSREDKRQVLVLANEVKPPHNLAGWFSTLPMKTLPEVPELENEVFAKFFLCKAFPSGFFKEMKEVLNSIAYPGPSFGFLVDTNSQSPCEAGSEGEESLLNSTDELNIEDQFEEPELSDEGENDKKKFKAECKVKTGSFSNHGSAEIRSEGLFSDPSGLNNFRPSQYEEPEIRSLELGEKKKKTKKKRKGIKSGKLANNDSSEKLGNEEQTDVMSNYMEIGAAAAVGPTIDKIEITADSKCSELNSLRSTGAIPKVKKLCKGRSKKLKENKSLENQSEIEVEIVVEKASGKEATLDSKHETAADSKCSELNSLVPVGVMPKLGKVKIRSRKNRPLENRSEAGMIVKKASEQESMLNSDTKKDLDFDGSSDAKKSSKTIDGSSDARKSYKTMKKQQKRKRTSEENSPESENKVIGINTILAEPDSPCTSPHKRIKKAKKLRTQLVNVFVGLEDTTSEASSVLHIGHEMKDNKAPLLESRNLNDLEHVEGDFSSSVSGSKKKEHSSHKYVERFNPPLHFQTEQNRVTSPVAERGKMDKDKLVVSPGDKKRKHKLKKKRHVNTVSETSDVQEVTSKKVSKHGSQISALNDCHEKEKSSLGTDAIGELQCVDVKATPSVQTSHVYAEGLNPLLDLQMEENIDASPVADGGEMEEQLVISSERNSPQFVSPGNKKRKHKLKKKQHVNALSETDDVLEVTPKKKLSKCGSQVSALNESHENEKSFPGTVAIVDLQGVDMEGTASVQMSTKNKKNVKDKSSAGKHKDSNEAQASPVHCSLEEKNMSQKEKISENSFENSEAPVSADSLVSKSLTESSQEKTRRKKRKSKTRESLCDELVDICENVAVKENEKFVSEPSSLDASHGKSNKAKKKAVHKESLEVTDGALENIEKMGKNNSCNATSEDIEVKEHSSFVVECSSLDTSYGKSNKAKKKAIHKESLEVTDDALENIEEMGKNDSCNAISENIEVKERSSSFVAEHSSLDTSYGESTSNKKGKKKKLGNESFEMNDSKLKSIEEKNENDLCGNISENGEVKKRHDSFISDHSLRGASLCESKNSKKGKKKKLGNESFELNDSKLKGIEGKEKDENDLYISENVEVKKRHVSSVTELSSLDVSHGESKSSKKGKKTKLSTESFEMTDSKLESTERKEEDKNVSLCDTKHLSSGLIQSTDIKNESHLSCSIETSGAVLDVGTESKKMRNHSSFELRKSRDSVFIENEGNEKFSTIGNEGIEVLNVDKKESLAALNRSENALDGGGHSAPKTTIQNRSDEDDIGGIEMLRIDNDHSHAMPDPCIKEENGDKISSDEVQILNDDFQVTASLDQREGTEENTRHCDSPADFPTCAVSTSMDSLCDATDSSDIPEDYYERFFSKQNVEIVDESESSCSSFIERMCTGKMSNILLSTQATPNKSNQNFGSTSLQNQISLSTSGMNLNKSSDKSSHTEKVSEDSYSPLKVSNSADTSVVRSPTRESCSLKSPSKAKILPPAEPCKEEKLFSDSSDSELNTPLLSRVKREIERSGGKSKILNESANEKFQHLSPAVKASSAKDLMLFLEPSSGDECTSPKTSPKELRQPKTHNESFLSQSGRELNSGKNVDEKNVKDVEEKSDSMVSYSSKDTVADISDINLLVSVKNEKQSLVPELCAIGVTSIQNGSSPKGEENRKIDRNESLSRVGDYDTEDNTTAGVSEMSTEVALGCDSNEKSCKTPASVHSTQVSPLQRPFQMSETTDENCGSESSIKSVLNEHVISKEQTPQTNLLNDSQDKSILPTSVSLNSSSDSSNIGISDISLNDLAKGENSPQLTSQPGVTPIRKPLNGNNILQEYGNGDSSDNDSDSSSVVPPSQLDQDHNKAVKHSGRKDKPVLKIPETLHSSDTKEKTSSNMANKSNIVLSPSGATSSPMKLSPPELSPCLKVDHNLAADETGTFSPLKNSVSCEQNNSTPSSENLSEPSSFSALPHAFSDSQSIDESDDDSADEKKESAALKTPSERKSSGTLALQNSSRVKPRLCSPGRRKSSPGDKRSSPALETSPGPNSKVLEKEDSNPTPRRYSARIRCKQIANFPGEKLSATRKKNSLSKVCLSESSSMMDVRNHLDFSDLWTPQSSSINKNPLPTTVKSEGTDATENVSNLNDVKSPRVKTNLSPSPWKDRLRTPVKTVKSPPSRNSSSDDSGSHNDHYSNGNEPEPPVWKNAAKGDGGLFPAEPKQYSRKKRYSSSESITSGLGQSLGELCLTTSCSGVLETLPENPSVIRTASQTSFVSSVSESCNKSSEEEEARPSSSKSPPESKDSVPKLIFNEVTPSSSSKVKTKSRHIFGTLKEALMPSSCSKVKTRKSTLLEASEHDKQGYNLRSRKSFIMPPKLNI